MLSLWYVSVNRVWPRAAVQLCRGCVRTGSRNPTLSDTENAETAPEVPYVNRSKLINSNHFLYLISYATVYRSV